MLIFSWLIQMTEVKETSLVCPASSLLLTLCEHNSPNLDKFSQRHFTKSIRGSQNAQESLQHMASTHSPLISSYSLWIGVHILLAAAAKSLQSCPTLCDPIYSTRLHRPLDSPGKKTGVGCHFLLQCMKVKSESEVAHSCQTLCHPMDCSLPGSSVHGIFQARVHSL